VSVLPLIFVAACGSEDAPTFEYPLDDALAFQHVQAKGTHNSYHVAAAEPPSVDLAFTHRPLDEQLGAQGVRQFELDLNIDAFEERFEVYHFLRIDEETTCRLLVDCLRDLKGWSDDHPAHHPIAVMLEIKDGFDPAYADRFFELLEAEILSVWPRERLVTPDVVRGGDATLAEAIATRGWPALGELRGKALLFLLDEGEHRRVYTHGDASLDGRLAFATVDLGAPYAAVHKIDDPVAGAADIAAAVAAGMLIRTRIDRVGDTGPEVDPDLFDAALGSGAHFLSTDVPDTALPGGAPSRCNPVTAPAACTAEAVEDPAFID
jgi:hypothetical protein